MSKFLLLNGKSEDILKSIPDNTFHAVVTSPPYWSLRDYFHADQLGNEETPEEYIDNLVNILREVKRTLREDGTMWLNIGDSYNNTAGYSRAKSEWRRKGREGGSAEKKAIKHSVIKTKDLFGMPWRVAFALQEDGWYLRCDVIWKKSNPMPDGAKDRPTHGHEYMFLMSKSPRYFYDYYAVQEETNDHPEGPQRFGAKNQKGTFRCDQDRTFKHYGKRNKRSVWETSVSTFQGDHFATYPPQLIEPCILASTSEKGCCSKCGDPLYRISLKEENKEDVYGEDVDIQTGEKEKVSIDKKFVLKDNGWEKRCDCKDSIIVPCRVLDPFSGMATTGLVCLDHNRNYVGIELNKNYLDRSRKRLKREDLHFGNKKIDYTDMCAKDDEIFSIEELYEE